MASSTDGQNRDVVSSTSSQDGVCRDYLRNVCRRGDRCRFLHPVDPTFARRDVIVQQSSRRSAAVVFCHDFQNAPGCRRGAACRFAANLADKRHMLTITRQFIVSCYLFLFFCIMSRRHYKTPLKCGFAVIAWKWSEAEICCFHSQFTASAWNQGAVRAFRPACGLNWRLEANIIPCRLCCWNFWLKLMPYWICNHCCTFSLYSFRIIIPFGTAIQLWVLLSYKCKQNNNLKKSVTVTGHTLHN